MNAWIVVGTDRSPLAQLADYRVMVSSDYAHLAEYPIGQDVIPEKSQGVRCSVADGDSPNSAL